MYGTVGWSIESITMRQAGMEGKPMSWGSAGFAAGRRVDPAERAQPMTWPEGCGARKCSSFWRAHMNVVLRDK